MTTFNHTDPDDPPQDSAANIAHDLKYGWTVKDSRNYSNFKRNPEYTPACPQSWLVKAKDDKEAHQIIWNWHNRQLPLTNNHENDQQKTSDRILFER